VQSHCDVRSLRLSAYVFESEGLGFTNVSVDPLEPMFRPTVKSLVSCYPIYPVSMYVLARYKILKIISSWDSLRLGSSQEILHNWVSVVSKRDFDRSLKAMEIPIYFY